jgi:hypothetical protein
MNLYARGLPVANDRTADTARSLGKTSRNMIILVSLKLAVQIELIAVAIAAQLKIDFMLGATTRSVCGLATDALGRFVGRLDGTGAWPVSVKIAKRTLSGPGQNQTGSHACEEQKNDDACRSGRAPEPWYNKHYKTYHTFCRFLLKKLTRQRVFARGCSRPKRPIDAKTALKYRQSFSGASNGAMWKTITHLAAVALCARAMPMPLITALASSNWYFQGSYRHLSYFKRGL